ncbi:2268_t:CDS:2, partial [Dentiscutata erythropus]
KKTLYRCREGISNQQACYRRMYGLENRRSNVEEGMPLTVDRVLPWKSPTPLNVEKADKKQTYYSSLAEKTYVNDFPFSNK